MGVRSSLLYLVTEENLLTWQSILERREEREMVDSHSESYAVQERELQKRLPTVPPNVIRHSLREVSPSPGWWSHSLATDDDFFLAVAC